MNSYGESSHYIGEKGRDYFEWQNQFAPLGAKLNSKKFSSYIKPQDQVLDFGCGGGWILRELTCRNRIGVELNAEAHECCRVNGVTVYSSVDGVVERNIDVCISHHCLEHVPYPIAALKLIGGLLRPGGTLVIVVPIDDWRGQQDFKASDINHHLHTWSPLLLANTLSEAGYAIADIRVLTHAWFPGWIGVYNKIPNWVFDALCGFWSVIRRRRQLLAVATRT